MDSLFYWLQMKLVCEVRPADEAARETAAFFAQILSEDHGLTAFDVASVTEDKIYVAYRNAEGERTVWFDKFMAEQMVHHPIISNLEKEAEKERGQS